MSLRIFIISVLTILMFSCAKEDNIPSVIKDIPVKIEVRHSPSEIYAEKNTKTNYYYWKHKTYVKSLIDDIKIIEFGTYNYKNGKWILGNYTKSPFKTDRFELWYSRETDNGKIDFCEDGILKKGVEYCDENNYSVKNKELVERNGLWYYIGRDKDNKLVCGYGKYHVNPKLK